MHLYQVGRPYNPERKIWPQTPQFNLRGGEAELVLFFDQPTEREAEAVRQDPADFGLYREGEQIVLCYSFGKRVPWSDAPFSIHRVPLADRVVPDPEQLGPETRAILQVILVNAQGGEIRAMRQLSLAPDFTRALWTAVHEQAQLPWDQAQYDRGLALLYRRYPTTEALVRACQYRTRGGS